MLAAWSHHACPAAHCAQAILTSFVILGAGRTPCGCLRVDFYSGARRPCELPPATRRLLATTERLVVCRAPRCECSGATPSRCVSSESPWLSERRQAERTNLPAQRPNRRARRAVLPSAQHPRKGRR